MERCLACEADGERSDIVKNDLVVHLRSMSFQELDPHYRRAMLQSVEIERDMARDFPLLTIGLASEAAPTASPYINADAQPRNQYRGRLHSELGFLAF